MTTKTEAELDKWFEEQVAKYSIMTVEQLKAHTAKAVEEARTEELKRLRRRFNGTNYVQLRKTINYRISQLKSKEQS